MNILNQEISCFRNYYVTDNPRPVNLLKWLRTDKYRYMVERIRSTADASTLAELKGQLPAITPSGIFAKRNRSSLVRHSGLICIDIDRKGNSEITNFPELKRELSNLQNVAYAGLSVSGNGFFLLVPIDNPRYHEEHFQALFEDFESFGVTIDRSCSNVDRLRGASWDPDGYFNPNAIPYQKRKQKAPTLSPHYRPDAIPAPAGPIENPWDDFNQKTSGLDLLVRHGWVIVRETDSKVYLRRPGNTNASNSGNYSKEQNIFVCYSSSTGFNPGKGYAPAAILAILEHGGDFSAMASALRRKGFGS